MQWKCPKCGFEANPPNSRSCGLQCGYDRIHRRVLLIASGTSRQIAMSVDTLVGKHLLRSFAGDDAVYASDPQFKIYKDAVMAGWALQHVSTAKNPTFCNGSPATDAPVLLSDGGTVSIGPERMRLTVRLED